MDRQTEREYREALDALRFSGEGKERIMKNLMEEGKRPVKAKRFKVMRTGLIAAAVCAALVGTAFAATAVYRLTVQTGEETFEDHEYVRYDVYGDPVIHPLEDFSQELQDDFAAWNHPSLLFHQDFDAWEDARAYLGDNIPVVWHDIPCVWHSSLSGNAEQSPFAPVEYHVEGYHEMYGDNKLQFVDVRDNGVRLNDMLSFTTELFIYTPDYRWDALTGEGWWKDEGEVHALDSYTMANGCVAEVVVGSMSYENEDGETHNYIGTFMKDGILYKVDMFVAIQCPLGEAELEAQLHQILDRFD